MLNYIQVNCIFLQQMTYSLEDSFSYMVKEKDFFRDFRHLLHGFKIQNVSFDLPSFFLSSSFFFFLHSTLQKVLLVLTCN